MGDHHVVPWQYRNELTASSLSAIGPLEGTARQSAGPHWRVPHPPHYPIPPALVLAQLPPRRLVNLMERSNDARNVFTPVSRHDLFAVPTPFAQHQQSQSSHISGRQIHGIFRVNRRWRHRNLLLSGAVEVLHLNW